MSRLTMTNAMHHYTECGLYNVFLVNGFERRDTPYGPGISIADVDGLHIQIGLALIERTGSLSGAELRFLRHELDLSQHLLGTLLGVDAQTVARWEKGETRIHGSAQRLLAGLWRERFQGSAALQDLLERISQLDADLHRTLSLTRTADDRWEVAA